MSNPIQESPQGDLQDLVQDLKGSRLTIHMVPTRHANSSEPVPAHNLKSHAPNPQPLSHAQPPAPKTLRLHALHRQTTKPKSRGLCSTSSVHRIPSLNIMCREPGTQGAQYDKFQLRTYMYTVENNCCT